MKRRPTQTKGHLWLAFVAAILMGANVLAVKTFDVYGSPALFALAILAEVCLFGSLVYFLVCGLSKQLSDVGSIALSAIEGMLTNPILKRRRDTQAMRWLATRLDANKAWGLPATIVVTIALVWLIGFFKILLPVVWRGPLTQIDTRVINLIPSIRTPLQTQIFTYATFLGSAVAIAFVVVTTAIMLWLSRQRLSAIILAASTIVTEVLGYSIKLLVGRVRPDVALRLVKQESYSFPSGHALISTVVYGVLAYWIYRSLRSSLARLIVGVVYIATVFMVSLSRIYLAVHYPSDVIGSILLGGFILTLVIGACEVTTRYPPKGESITFANKRLLVVPVILAAFSLVVTPFLTHILPTLATPGYMTLPVIDEASVQQLPHYSETLTGRPMEPINFVYSGSESQIIQLFATHGWLRADPSTIANTLKAIVVGFQGEQYDTAPVTPSYLAARPQDLAFQQPTATHNLRQRHHTRLWRMGYNLPDGTPIWTATASLDEGIGLAGPAKLPTHHINPDIDAERTYIARSLGLPVNLIHVVNPQLGHNASGDAFFTDGKALVVKL